MKIIFFLSILGLISSECLNKLDQYSCLSSLDDCEWVSTCQINISNVRQNNNNNNQGENDDDDKCESYSAIDCPKNCLLKDYSLSDSTINPHSPNVYRSQNESLFEQQRGQCIDKQYGCSEMSISQCLQNKDNCDSTTLSQQTASKGNQCINKSTYQCSNKSYFECLQSHDFCSAKQICKNKSNYGFPSNQYYSLRSQQIKLPIQGDSPTVQISNNSYRNGNDQNEKSICSEFSEEDCKSNSHICQLSTEEAFQCKPNYEFCHNQSIANCLQSNHCQLSSYFQCYQRSECNALSAYNCLSNPNCTLSSKKQGFEYQVCVSKKDSCLDYNQQNCLQQKCQYEEHQVCSAQEDLKSLCNEIPRDMCSSYQFCNLERKQSCIPIKQDPQKLNDCSEYSVEECSNYDHCFKESICSDLCSSYDDNSCMTKSQYCENSANDQIKNEFQCSSKQFNCKLNQTENECKENNKCDWKNKTNLTCTSPITRNNKNKINLNISKCLNLDYDQCLNSPKQCMEQNNGYCKEQSISLLKPSIAIFLLLLLLII